jgi:integrase
MAILRLKDGRWICYWRDKATAKLVRKYFGQGADAESAARQFNASLGLAHRRQSDSPPSGPLFGDLVNRYAAAKAASIQPVSLDNFMWKMEGIVIPAIGRLRAMSVTPDVLDRYVTQRLKTATRTDKRTGKPLTCIKRTTVHRELSDIRAVLNWAVRRRIIPWNPAAGFEMPTRDDDIISPPTHAEIAAVLAVAPAWLHRALCLSYYTGTRPGGELLSRRWEDVDSQAGTIFIESAKKGGRRVRVVELHPDLQALLATWQAEDEKLAVMPKTIINFRGRAIGSLKTSWRTAKRKAGITRRLRPYDFRHAFASYALRQNADLKSVSEILGHSRTDTTTRIYQHTDTAQRRAAVNKLPSIVNPTKNEAG